MIIFGGYDGVTHNTPAGYTLIHNADFCDWWCNEISVFAKFSDGSDGADVTITTSGSPSGNDWTTAVAYRIGDAHALPEAASSADRSIYPDPPNLSPSFGSQNTVWLAASFNGANPDVLEVPVDYSNLLSARNPDDFSLYSMERALETVTEDPSRYTVEEMWNDPWDWIALTIAIY